MHVMTGVHVVTRARAFVIMRSSGCTAIVTLLNLVYEVVFLVTLAFVRWAVTLGTRIVVADTHHRVR
jgi:hypothetical protein